MRLERPPEHWSVVTANSQGQVIMSVNGTNARKKEQVVLPSR